MARFRQSAIFGLALGAAVGCAWAGTEAAGTESAGTEVDLELVLAVDVSRSMDFYEAELQRQGYAKALRHPEFLKAVASGAHGRIAIAYVEWAGSHHQQTVVEWTLIDGAASAHGVADAIQLAPFVQEFRTSISQALAYSAQMFADNGFDGLRRVIDMSGDGANNQGLPVNSARDGVVAQGITINGLPIMTGRPNRTGWLTLDNLDAYYRDCVIGGPGAFLVPVRERGEFIEAIRRKLILEVAGRVPAERARIIKVAAPVDCLIGETMWQRYRSQRGWDDPF